MLLEIGNSGENMRGGLRAPARRSFVAFSWCSEAASLDLLTRDWRLRPGSPIHRERMSNDATTPAARTSFVRQPRPFVLGSVRTSSTA